MNAKRVRHLTSREWAQAAGIPAVQSPSSTSTTWGTFGTMPSLPHRVLVPLERLEEAMSILESEDEEA